MTIAYILLSSCWLDEKEKVVTHVNLSQHVNLSGYSWRLLGGEVYLETKFNSRFYLRFLPYLLEVFT